MRKLPYAAVIVFALALLAFALRTPDTDPQAMTVKYTNAHSRFVENDAGLLVHYRDEGNPGGIPIVLLHGNSASLHTWAPLVERLGAKYRIITYTHPGHGLTGPHPRDDYSFTGMADALDLVANELALDSFVLGGNSMGGWVAWRYALANPEKVDALLLLDASGMPLREGETAPPLNLGFRLQQNAFGRFLLQQFTPRNIVKKSLLDTVSVNAIVDEAMVDRYWELLRLPGNRKAAAHRALADREPHMAQDVGTITAPALVIWGAEDQLIYATAAETFDERLPNAEVVIYDGVGHLPMEEAPDRTAEDIDRFLERTLNVSE